MKKLIGIVFGIFVLVLLAGCQTKTDITATFYDVDVSQTSIVLSIEVNDPNNEITGTISVKLLKPDDTLANNKDLYEEAEYQNISFTGLDNSLKYTVEVYATVGRDAVLIGTASYTLLSAETIHITTTEQFLDMDSNRSGNYVLDNNLDFTGVSFSSPFSASFSGIFDGQGYTISNVTYSVMATYTGLFGYVSSGTIKNLVIDQMHIGTAAAPLHMNTSSRVGILAGYVSSSNANIENITITNSEINYSSSSTVQAYVGAVVGEFKGSMTAVTVDNTSIELLATSYGKIKMGGAVALLSDDATLKEVKTNASIIFNLEGNLVKNKDVSINIGGVIGDHHAINKSKSVENITSSSDINVDLDFGTAVDTTSGNYAVYVGGLAGFASSNIINAFYHGSITLTHEKNDNEADVNKAFFVGGVIGYFGSRYKINEQVVRYGNLQTIDITVSDDVNLKASQTFGGTNTTVQQLVGRCGDESLMINAVSEVASDPSPVCILAEMADFFTSDWIQTEFDSVLQ